MTGAAPAGPDIEALAVAVAKGERAGLARAITLIESRRADHRVLAGELIDRLLPETGRAIRIGITGVPGVGKSTTIDQLGSNLTALGHKVAVLAVDPSSSVSGGSILGDKTRMARLAVDRNAFVRPSPSAGSLGGVAARTRETMLLCEAAGHDVVLVETVGVGQSETTVADMVDVFVVLMLPGAGDELQGIKKGIVERADIICVNKADGDGAPAAREAAGTYRAAFSIISGEIPDWRPPVLLISGRANLGLDELWAEIRRHRAVMEAGGRFTARRRSQEVHWMHRMIADRLDERLRRDPAARRLLSDCEQAVARGEMSATRAANDVAALVGL